MDAERLWEEYNKLPAEAQAEVVDFLAFLKMRHGDKTQRTEQQQIDWKNEPFVGMWRDRDDISDGGRWVRELREREWSRDRV
jgi:hypothetical protein